MDVINECLINNNNVYKVEEKVIKHIARSELDNGVKTKIYFERNFQPYLENPDKRSFVSKKTK